MTEKDKKSKPDNDMIEEKKRGEN
jgi:hypothetical protein